MKAIILAAGQGTRLRPYTNDRPKCLVKLNGKTLLEYQIEKIEQYISDITVITGYRSDQIRNLGYQTIQNPRFDQTNMLASLMQARNHFDGSSDLLISYGDIIFEREVVKKLQKTRPDISIAVNLDWKKLWETRMEDPLEDAESLKMSDGKVLEIGKKADSYADIQGQYMGLFSIKAATAPRLLNYFDSLSPEQQDRMDLTTFLQNLIEKGFNLYPEKVQGGWLEIDSTEDLELYERLMKEGRLAEYCQIDV